MRQLIKVKVCSGFRGPHTMSAPVGMTVIRQLKIQSSKQDAARTKNKALHMLNINY